MLLSSLKLRKEVHKNHLWLERRIEKNILTPFSLLGSVVKKYNYSYLGINNEYSLMSFPDKISIDISNDHFLRNLSDLVVKKLNDSGYCAEYYHPCLKISVKKPSVVTAAVASDIVRACLEDNSENTRRDSDAKNILNILRSNDDDIFPDEKTLSTRKALLGAMLGKIQTLKMYENVDFTNIEISLMGLTPWQVGSLGEVLQKLSLGIEKVQGNDPALYSVGIVL